MPTIKYNYYEKRANEQTYLRAVREGMKQNKGKATSKFVYNRGHLFGPKEIERVKKALIALGQIEFQKDKDQIGPGKKSVFIKTLR